jgi:hypothetical protein
MLAWIQAVITCNRKFSIVVVGFESALARGIVARNRTPTPRWRRKRVLCPSSSAGLCSSLWIYSQYTCQNKLRASVMGGQYDRTRG